MLRLEVGLKPENPVDARWNHSEGSALSVQTEIHEGATDYVSITACGSLKRCTRCYRIRS